MSKELTEICNEYGWSYGSYHEDPVLLVRGLFLKIRTVEDQCKQADVQNLEWLSELKEILSNAPGVQYDDPFKTVRRIVVELRTRIQAEAAAEAEAEVQPTQLSFKRLSNAQVAALGHAVIAELQARGTGDYP